ncbi:MAG: thioredoxin-disulfide reductase [Desulfurococcales archaeon]|nr:thioredoxin-disulfide reductase [Desulfurococcales archaeon]
MKDMEQVVIAGSGPAGLTAAIYSARAELAPLVFEGLTPGGQLTVSYGVENYPGFPESLSGMELMNRFHEQAEKFGTRFDAAVIEGVVRVGDILRVQANDKHVETKALIIATGAQARRLPILSEKRFYGKGVSGCATCDGFFFRDKNVLVVGGGNTAMQDALFLTKFASKVTIVHRREYLRADPIEVSKAKKNPTIEWMIPWVVEEILGDDVVTGARLRNTESDEVQDVKCEGIFVAIGHEPKTEAFRDVVETDEKGFIIVAPGTTKTSTEGVFACGDVCDREYKQAVVAAGHGCMAAMEVERYLGIKE